MSYIEKEKLIKADIASIENRVRHAFNQGYDLGYKEGKERSKAQEPTTKNDLALIHTEGLDEEIRCTMCTNHMKSDRGCDGSCVVNKDMYKAVMDAIEKRIQPTTKKDLGVDSISRQEVLRLLANSIGKTNTYLQTEVLKMSSVTPQSKTGHCKDCKWWKDSDGEYRRGCGAESQCPINRREVFEGNGYCFLFEPQESE